MADPHVFYFRAKLDDSYKLVGKGLSIAYKVTDTSDQPGDSPAQLGDVMPDKFLLTDPNNTTANNTTGTYLGYVNQGKSFVGITASGEKRLYSNTDYAFNTTFVVTKKPFEFACFASGSRILTARGETAVEDLVVGDLAVTASGQTRHVRWIGHRTIDCRRHPRPEEAHPVCVRAHAFGTGLPERDLYLSPGHPILVGADEEGTGGHLVPVMCLINGTSIDRAFVDEITYWHVELDAHDILLAEGLPAESYLDWGDRGFFEEGSDHALKNPDFVVPGLGGRCRPIAVDGPVVEAERRRLDAVFLWRLTGACAWPSGAVETTAF